MQFLMTSSAFSVFDRVLFGSSDEREMPSGPLLGLASAFLLVAIAIRTFFGQDVLRVAALVAAPTFLALALLGQWRGRIARLLWRSALASAILYGLLRGAAAAGDYQLIWLYGVPPMVYFFFGKREGTAWALLALAGWLGVVFGPLLGGSVLPHSPSLISRFLFSYALASVLAFEVEWWRRHYLRKLSREAETLRRTLDDIETLKGLVPICASCKSVRDDRGFWSKIETYLQEHSLAHIDEALCPECRSEFGSGAQSCPK